MFQVFYMKDGEVHHYLSSPTSEDNAHEWALRFEKEIYKPGRMKVSRPWVGRV